MTMKLADIKPYEKNAKEHSPTQVRKIAASIKEFGFNQPIVVDKAGVIIVGHGRLLAAELLGLDEAPTIVVDLSEEQAKAYRLADNKLAESPWDMKLVIEELKALPGAMIDLTGFSRDLVLEEEDKDDDIPPLPRETRIEAGDLFQLGRHRLLVGDATSGGDFDRLMQGVKADMIFTDPPYNVAYTGMQNSKQWEEIAHDDMSPADFQAFLSKAFRNMADFSKGEAALYCCHADRSHREFRAAFEAEGYEWRATIVWVKNSPAFNFAQYKYKHEPIFYLFKKGRTVSWYGDMTNNTVWKADWSEKKILKWFHDTLAREAESGRTTVWEAKKEIGAHPTLKPVSLITRALANSSKQDDIILDPFMGGAAR